MECMTPGIQKNRVKKIFNINAPILPVDRMASGGSKKHKKYLMAIILADTPYQYHLEPKDWLLLRCD
jgi:hypothetical protein